MPFPTNSVKALKGTAINRKMFCKSGSRFAWKVAIQAAVWCVCVVWHRVVMVLGAGRGPLVSATIRASLQAGRVIRVYAVEKNPNAVVTYVAGRC